MKPANLKKNTSRSIRLGLFIVIGISLFLAGIYLIGAKQQLFNRTFRVHALFKDVNGLQIGNNVRFAGINVGIVEGIGILNDTSVKVTVIIDEETQPFIRKDAMAVIGSDGLMGNRILTITPGTTGRIEDDDIIGSITPINMDEIMTKLKLTTDNALSITTDLSAVAHNIRSGKGTIGKLFMDSSFAGSLDQTITNVEQGSKGFKQNMEAARNSILLRGFFKKSEKDKEKEKVNEKK